jgi:hypothetical protein
MIPFGLGKGIGVTAMTLLRRGTKRKSEVMGPLGKNQKQKVLIALDYAA